MKRIVKWFAVAGLIVPIVLFITSQIELSINHERVPWSNAGRTAYREGHFATALRELTPLAEHGVAGAQFLMGVMYGAGEGVTQDSKEALRWYRLFGEQGNQKFMASSYKYGLGLPGILPDLTETVRWYRMAAAQGDAEAELYLGDIYAKDVLPWYRRAIKMGWMYAREGLPWYRRATQFILGFMAGIREAVPQDYIEAVYWYRRAAEHGHDRAQFELGHMYATGQGVPQDYTQVLHWYRLSADQGNANARFNLGEMYSYDNRGVTQDHVQALMWLMLAEAAGYPGVAFEIGLLTKQMSQSQKEEAQRLALTWNVKK